MDVFKNIGLAKWIRYNQVYLLSKLRYKWVIRAYLSLSLYTSCKIFTQLLSHVSSGVVIQLRSLQVTKRRHGSLHPSHLPLSALFTINRSKKIILTWRLLKPLKKDPCMQIDHHIIRTWKYDFNFRRFLELAWELSRYVKRLTSLTLAATFHSKNHVTSHDLRSTAAGRPDQNMESPRRVLQCPSVGNQS